MDISLTMESRQIKPAVCNLFQYENQTTTLNFMLDSYIYEETDLRNFKAYAITSLKGVVDMTELEMSYDGVDDVLTLSWEVGAYTLQESGAIVYQIVFKGNEDDGLESAAWYSYNGIIINRGSVDADYKIVAEYPTIMKQWLDKINVMSDRLENDLIADMEQLQKDLMDYVNRLSSDFNAVVIYIPYGDSIDINDRLEGRVYYQFTNSDNTRGQFEDHLGNILISEYNGAMPLFAHDWFDHHLNDASYLRADTFSWHSGDIYTSAYEHLVNKISGLSSTTDDNGIVYYLTDDKLKICLPDQESALIELFESTGNAWYYILDTDNKQFKLPRKSYDGVDPKYLYFFVGNYVRGITEVNVGTLTEIVNGTDITEIAEEINALKEEALSEIQDCKQALITISETSGTVALAVNNIYTMEITADTEFTLPETVDTAYFNQIKVMAKVTGTPAITWGTSYFMNKSEPEIEEGYYDFYFDYDNHLAGWVVGALVKGA